MRPSMRAAAAGAGAATVWAGLEPVDRRLFRYGYSDVAVLGKALTRGPLWPAAGLAWHAVNGALAGVVFAQVNRKLGGSTVRNAIGFALAEHIGLFPLSALVDRYHPARGDPDLPPIATSGRAFAQATFRHLVFGVVLGVLAPRGRAA